MFSMIYIISMQICVLTVLSASQTSTKAKPNNSFICRKSVHCQIRNAYSNSVTSNITNTNQQLSFVFILEIITGIKLDVL